MFLKRLRKTKNGKRHTYWALVESHRTKRGPRHRVVSYLGELSESELGGWARLGASLDGKAAIKARQLSLFDDALSENVPEAVNVRLRGVHVKRTRDFGEVFLALTLWKMLDLDELFEDKLPKGREGVPWALMGCLLTVARFVHPSSELHTADFWYGRTVLFDLLGVHPDDVYHTRLYRTLDKFLPLKAEIESHLKGRFGELFDLDFEILLYDVTSTYFEGNAERNPQAKRGYSRDKRSDCKQVCVALVATREGFPLAYEVFDGNRTDVTTVEDIVEAVEEKYGKASRVWVMDRGMVSEDNLEFLRERNGRYLVGTPRSQLKAYEHHLLEDGWEEVRAGVEVKLVEGPKGKETFVLCRSEDRVEKEKAIHARFLERVEAALTKLETSLADGKRRRRIGPTERQIGRLLQKNSRAANAFDIKVTEDADRESGLRLTWVRKEAWDEWASLSEGCYLLRTNVTGLSAKELWTTYIQLTDVEEAFRTQKSELKIRPIWHQLQARVQAHILFSFLAYALWKTLQTWMDRAGLGRGVRTILNVFSELKVSDVHLPTTDGREVRLRCITQPNKAQKAILDRLGVTIPARLGRAAWVPATDTT